MLKTAKAILIVKMAAIGDVLMATPLAETLRKAYPNAHLAWLVEERCKDVVLGNPYLDEVIIWKRRKSTFGISAGMPVVKSLRSRGFDIAIDAQGLLRSSLMCYFSGAGIRVGFRDGRELSPLFYNTSATVFSPYVLESHRRLVKPLGISPEAVSSSMLFPLSDADFAQSREILTSHQVDERAIAVIAPATTWPNKHWVETEWARVVDALSSIGLTTLFLGSRASSGMIDRIRSFADSPSVSLAGETSLKQAGALMSMARLTISIDTGLMHISTAVGTPTVAIFGPTGEWVNHADKPNFQVVRKDDFPCSPCRRKPTCENFDCMQAVTAEEVMEAAARLLKDGIMWRTCAEEST